VDATHTSPPAAEALHVLLASNHEIADFLNDLARLAASEIIGTPDGYCAILLSRKKRKTVVGHSSQVAKDLDEIQAGFDEGPCLEAQAQHEVILSSDVHDETRWPQYMATLRGSRIRSVLAVPLLLDGAATAAINFYALEPRSFDDEDIDKAQRFASLASLAVSVALRIADAAQVAADRQQAMESRTAIDLAIGIIMAQQSCTQQEAFDVLAKVSSIRNVKVRDLAQELVASVGKSQPQTAFDG